MNLLALTLTGIFLMTYIRNSQQENLQVIQSGLQDAIFPVGSTGYLTVRVNASSTDDAQWLKDGTQLVQIPGKLLLLSSSGGVRQLVVYNIQLSDAGQYSYVTKGESTSAYLSVTGSNPVNGGWSEWSQWIKNKGCSATCGTSDVGTESRSRICNNPAPQNGGLTCSGPSDETRQAQCGPAVCPINGAWSNWGSWGNVINCAATCGTSVLGTKERSRECNNPSPQNGGLDCPGSGIEIDTDFCTSVPSSCTASLFTLRLQDTTGSVGDQVVLTVALSQTGLSGTWYKDGVPVYNSERITTTGEGSAFYLIIDSLITADAGVYNFTVSGASTSAYLRVAGSDPVNGGWSEWSQWTGNNDCPVTCGTSGFGTESRSRTCSNPAPQNGGLTCSGFSDATRQAQCGPAACPINGAWSDWGSWGNVINCAATCGTSVLGTKERSRECNNPSPQNGGLTCPGPSDETQQALCGPAVCPINGAWSNWGSWGNVINCAATCGTSVLGTKERSRECNNPSPQSGGIDCPGSSTEIDTDFCTSIPSSCTASIFNTKLQDMTLSKGATAVFTAVLAQVGLTGTWSKDGVQIPISGRLQFQTSGKTHFLIISRIQYSDAGHYSFTVGGETTSAYLTISGAPVNGGWSIWSSWGTPICSETCGKSVVGVKSRTRSCTDPQPQNGGSDCQGQSTYNETIFCATTICPVSESGEWSSWSQWSESSCLVTCGSRDIQTLTRNRTCVTQPGEDSCVGDSVQTDNRTCGPPTCPRNTPLTGTSHKAHSSLFVITCCLAVVILCWVAHKSHPGFFPI